MASALNKGISQKKYSRNNAGWTGLCTYTATIPSVRAESNERASYSPHMFYYNEELGGRL